MSGKHPHDPSRFQIYKELPDGSGFTVKGSSFVFKFDRFGGWFDEHGNYYNSDGQPDHPHSDSQDYHSEGSHSHHSQADEYDEFEKEFGGPGNYVQEEGEVDVHFEKVARNVATLNNYPAGALRVHFRNLPYFSKRNEVFDYFKAKVAGVLNVICLVNEKQQFTGNGYFVVEDMRSGESLLRLEGEKYNSREVSFTLEDVEEFLLDPITNEELFPDFLNKKNTKNFITKGPKVDQQQQPHQQPQKSTKSQVKHEVKTEVKAAVKVQAKTEFAAKAKTEFPAKAQIKQAESQQQFADYIFQRKPFPKKSSFNEWIQLNKFSHQHDIQIVNKIQGDETRAKVTMKRKVYNALNGKQCNNVVVTFTPSQK